MSEGTTSGRAPVLRVPETGVFAAPEWHLWGGSAVRHEGLWYRIFARWPRELGFRAWVTHSEVAAAVGDSPIGPWRDPRPLFGRGDPSAWDGANCHNPLPLFAEGRYWIFYTGNRGNGDFWEHRNNQRVGVAVADHPLGPWERMTAPLIDTTEGGWDHLMTALPAVTRGPDGYYRMLYKGVSAGKPPFGGNVRVGLAVAPHPAGPWEKQPGNFFFVDGVQFPSDDNCLWYDGERYRAIVKDYGGYFQNAAKPALVLFESPDAEHWRLSEPDPVLASFWLEFADGGVRGPLTRLEQQQIIFEPNGRAVALALSVKERPDEDGADAGYCVHIPLEDGAMASLVGS